MRAPTSQLRAFQGTERFELKALLGWGANGTVYEALDREQGSRVALKVLANVSSQRLAAFKREFRSLQGLRHPNLVELFELNVQQNTWFLTMELVEGIDLLSYVRGLDGRVGPVSDSADAAPSDATLPEIPCHADPPARSGNVLPPCNEQRLRAAFAGLARGLAALHAARKVHRDIKPSNVLVDRAGRVVILDFGLVAELDAPSVSHFAGPVGTPRYMAPEQAAGTSLTAASDWYGAGALLYEALAGRPPFSGDREQMLVAKQHGLPASPASYRQGTPQDLCNLCLDLLAFVPEERPDAAEVLRRLGAPELTLEAAPLGAYEERDFVGREGELALLTEALSQVRQGRAASVLIEGESGLGKSALLREFIRRQDAQDPRLQFLFGRCFEREAVPYKAVDGLMDSIAAELDSWPQAELAPLGETLAIVARAFPVLERFTPEGSAASGEQSTEPQLDRQRVFAALRWLFATLAKRAPTVIAIDDLQWSDLDSLALLGSVLRAPNAPPLLLIACKRPGGLLDRVPLPGSVRKVGLSKLSTRESCLLAEHLLRELQNADASQRAREVAREAGGHPLFVRELVRSFGASRAQSEPARLDDVLWQRIRALPLPARRLVELAAVAGKPIPQSVALAAAREVDPSVSSPEESLPDALCGLAGSIAELRHVCLLRTGGAHPNDELDVYHDRIREAVLALLEPQTKRGHHRALAQALLRAQSDDAPALARHFQEAGEPSRGRDHAIRAAERAARALSFEQAIRLYELALELDSGPSAARRALMAKLGEAFANAGRGLDAARTYLEAGAGDPSTASLEYRRLAGEQLLRSGRIEAGVALVFRVLSELGVKPAPNRTFALLSLMLLRLRLSWRGFEATTQPGPRPAPKLEQARIDGLWTAATCLTMFDNVRSAELQCWASLRALRSGTKLQILRAHTAESIFQATAGNPARGRIQALRVRAQLLAQELADPYADGWVALSHGAAAFLLGDWAEGEEHCALAEDIFLRRSGALWELSSARAFGTWSAMMRGQFRRIVHRVPRFVAEAEGRGDLYAATLQMTGFSNVAWLSLDDVATARRMIALAEERWPGKDYDVPRYLNMVAATHIELYAGRGAAAHARVCKDWASLRFGIAFRAQITRFGMRFVRGLSALAAFDEKPAPGLLRDAEACARAMAAERVTWSGCFSDIVLAGAAARRGNSQQALDFLAAAENKAAGTGMALHHALVRSRRGELIGGDEGKLLVEQADVFMRAEAIQNPSRMIEMLTPSIRRK